MPVVSVVALVILAFAIEEVHLVSEVSMQAFGNFHMLKETYSTTSGSGNNFLIKGELNFKHEHFYYYKEPKSGTSAHPSGVYKGQHQRSEGLSGSFHDMTQIWCTGYDGEIDGDIAEHGFWILLFFYNKHPQNSRDLDEGVSRAFMVERSGSSVGIPPNIPVILATQHQHFRAVPPEATFETTKLRNIFVIREP